VVVPDPLVTTNVAHISIATHSVWGTFLPQRGSNGPPPSHREGPWPLHDIAIRNIVCCMAYNWEVGGGVRALRNSRAIVVQ